ncbi:hypothetical protein SETIT_5G236900v2 [Setaria italica]|uniref:Uncharacterized protein n=1 Tax=Setaria italica TaxID=4555 RepID=A0A368R818_SETIT|nr:hypothetical protein SETIT_5G236900v2 [Setaria italica]
MSAIGHEYKRRMGYMQYPIESDEVVPVPSAVPIPDCRCGVPTEVQQLRHPKIAGRAYYPLLFFWIHGSEKYDPRIRLFPYDRTKLEPYQQFRGWVPPPPNPPPMTEEEKQETAYRRVRDHPLCKWVPPKFIPFFRCSLKAHDGLPLCDFNEYIHEPKPLWPTEEQVREFETGKAPWLYGSFPSDRCKYGILATQGVVPSELGYGWFCGNAYGEYWVEARKRRIQMEELEERAEEARMEVMKALVADLPIGMAFGKGDKCKDGKEEMAKEAQMEAVKALVRELPHDNANVDKKGKGVVIVGDDDDDDDELLCEGDSD